MLKCRLFLISRKAVFLRDEMYDSQAKVLYVVGRQKQRNSSCKLIHLKRKETDLIFWHHKHGFGYFAKHVSF